MRGKMSTLISSRTAGPANLPLKIFAPPERLRDKPCCSDHGCTGRACGFGVPRPIRRHAGFLYSAAIATRKVARLQVDEPRHDCGCVEEPSASAKWREQCELR